MTKKVGLTVFAAAILIAGLLATGLFIHRAVRDSGYEPIASGPIRPVADSGGERIVLTGGDAEVSLPFAKIRHPSASGGVAVAVPESALKDGEAEGRALFSFAVGTEGEYAIWVRARWHDGCGNSVGLSVDGSDPVTIGQDAVYDRWHWVEAGIAALVAGEHRLELIAREDGISVDEIVMTDDPSFVPSGPMAGGGSLLGVRRFADRFDRSAGHGLGNWRVVSGDWQIAFSLDPNRIPNQFSLVGKPTGGNAAVIVADTPPWRGCRVALSFVAAPGSEFGIAGGPDREPWVVATTTDSDGRAVAVIGGTEVPGRPSGDGSGGPAAVLPGQWHRLELCRWGWRLSAVLDGRHELLDPEAYELEPGFWEPTFVVRRGSVTIDDVEVVEVPWLADDGGDYRMPWTASSDSNWERKRVAGGRGPSIRGSAGTLTVPDTGLSFVAADFGGLRGKVDVRGAEPGAGAGDPRGPATSPPGPVDIRAATPCSFDRIALRYGEAEPAPSYRIGPFAFAAPTLADPWDFFDFTEEEWKRINHSAESAVLRREPNQRQVIESAGNRDYAFWAIEGGYWRIDEGVLRAGGRDALLRLWQRVEGDVDLAARVRLSREGSSAEFLLGEHEGRAVTVRVGGASEAPADNGVHLPCAADGAWHMVRASLVRDEAAPGDGPAYRLHASLDDGAEVSAAVQPDIDGGILLRVPGGRVEFDDVEFTVPKRASGFRFWGFDGRETDWIRQGDGWMDHGGIACAMASNWVTLNAPGSEGMMWNKEPVAGAEVLVAFNIEENSEWFGWNTSPTHAHLPFDNIRVALSGSRDASRGYLFEFNVRESRRGIVLYRAGTEVASLPWDGRYPLQYVGGHAPYTPRRNRLRVMRQGAALSAVINGQELLRWEDPEPLGVASANLVGIGGRNTRVNISRIVVRDRF